MVFFFSWPFLKCSTITAVSDRTIVFTFYSLLILLSINSGSFQWYLEINIYMHILHFEYKNLYNSNKKLVSIGLERIFIRDLMD